VTQPGSPRLFPESGRELRSADRGVLPLEHIQELIADGVLHAEQPFEESQLQPASIDLRLGTTAIQVRASFLPGPEGTVEDAAAPLLIQRLDLSEGAIFQPGSVYIVPLMESLTLRSPELLAKANPKSTTGRLDVFARLITDHAERFDVVARGYRGPLYAEIAPKTFTVRVRAGTKLNQLRFLQSHAGEQHASRKASRDQQLVWDEAGQPVAAMVDEGLWFSVDLKGPDEVVGWRARRNTPVLDLEKIGYYDPYDFWEPVRRTDQLILQPDEFYILGSRERVRVPPAYAAEMVPYDQAMGEFRVHYAGFFDPGFGYGGGEIRGTRAVLEVRSYEVPYALKHGQRIGRLMYQPMLAEPGRLYGATGSSYQDQGLGLSKHFRRG